MKNYLLILCLFISFVGYAQLIKADVPKSAMSCDHKVSMSDDLLNKVLKHRDSAFATCLSCTKGDCSMKTWPEEGRANETICQRLFCTPKKVNRVTKFQLIHLEERAPLVTPILYPRKVH